MDTQEESSSLHWNDLYRVGAVAAFIAVFIFRRNLGAELSLIDSTPPPVSAGDWFALLQENPLLGLAHLEVFDIANYALVAMIFIGLFAALRRENAGAMLLALCMGLVGTGVYFASNQSFALWNLNASYAAATTETEQAVFEAAGEALLAIQNPIALYQGAGIYVSLLLVTLAGLGSSIVMLHSSTFPKFAAWMGIVGNTLILFHYPALAFAPEWIFLPHTLGAIPLIVWQFLIGVKLWRLSRIEPQAEAN